MSLRIVLVRHGLSSFNVEHRIQGRDDLSALTDVGVAQARSTGAALADVGFDAVYSSPLQRASDTAAHLLEVHGRGLTPSFDEDLLEIDLGPWSGLQRRELRERFPAQEAVWRAAPHSLELERRDGSRYRPLPELMQQAARFCRRLLESHAAAVDGADSSVLLVGHNAILRCLVLTLLGLDAQGFRRLRVDNGSISVLNISGAAAGTQSVQVESLNGTAHLGAPLPPRGPGPRLLLVRHGETDWNRQGRFQGQIDIPLNANGLAQAEAAGSFLASASIHRAYTSSMARPRQTAEVILAAHPGVPLTATRGLVEIGHGLWEGRLEREIAESWPQLLADWKRAPHTVEMPEGETIHEVWSRSLNTWSTIAASLDDQETALVVAHDAVNKTILCDLLGLTPADIWTIKQGNGGVTVVDYPQGAGGIPVVAAMNLTSHLGGVLDRTAAGAL
ncbi:histidine phosphatase family protein [Cyanobium sp. CH-040]|uniref:histidine phosphatase family protein n=1 Tax=Cyanobium sp. CH-040 TaxID=2823708 RepID=UPI0020CF9B48|nr:histidine phosphatase family protein [Cyanobium sp. CH-040]MCP9928132.1 histidine phosphatase family protein [Cyanobium sp. CH-040]